MAINNGMLDDPCGDIQKIIEDCSHVADHLQQIGCLLRLLVSEVASKDILIKEHSKALQESYNSYHNEVALQVNHLIMAQKKLCLFRDQLAELYSILPNDKTGNLSV